MSPNPAIGSSAWLAWLDATHQSSFRYASPQGAFTGRREAKAGRSYWYAYRKLSGRLRKAYLGRSDDLTLARLEAVAQQLAPAPTPVVVAANPLVGRARDLERALGRLRQSGLRVLTLTGPGGTGKTRLALALVDAARADFPDGVWFVDLSTIVDPALVGREIAHHLGIPDSSDRPVRERVHEHLAERTALIVLDNFEQILPAAADISALIQACPHLKVLVTSREPLHLRTETQLPIPPLAVSDAVELFVQRARAAGVDLDLDDATTRDLESLCARLDGLPLAIELAAARAKLFSARAMLARLDRQLDLLHVAEHDRATRHQSLRAAAAWSYDLLSEPERRAFRALSVFVGGCAFEAAESVLLGSGVLDDLASLVDKSLVLTESGAHGETRLRMLQTIRAFGLEQLAASDEDKPVRRRHATYFLDLVRPPSWESLDLPTPEFVDMVAADIDNIRAALQYALVSGETRIGVEITLAVQGFWLYAGYLSEGLRWMRDLLPRLDDRSALTTALAYHTAGQLAWRQGDYDSATAYYQQSVALRRERGDPFWIAVALQGLASVARDRGDVARAIALWEECLATFRVAGHGPRIARAALNLAISLHLGGESARAARLLDETIELARNVEQDWVEASARTYRALIALAVELDIRTAAAHVSAGLQLLDRVPDGWVVAHLVELAAYLAADVGDEQSAARLLAAAAAVRERMGARLHPVFASPRGACEERVRVALGAPAFDSAAQEGRALRDHAVRRLAARVAATADAAPTTARADTLSPREREIAVLVADGWTSRAIAERLVIGERTVESHIDHIRAKLGVRSRAQIAAWAVDRGLASPRR